MESCQKDIQLKEEKQDEGEWDFKGAKSQKRKTARIEIGFEPSSPHTLPGNGSTGCYFDIIPGLN